ncbi:histidine phosphatase family protein, partial [Actinotalea ferrariae]|uniref:histidine phosphatase family protein n=1 Tax=Actinotalea ferrariae TaxID=1386098 RepID=UPI001C8B5CBD
PARDADVALSPLGAAQARALGAWLGDLPPSERPDAVWASPYERAHQTALLALGAAGLDLRVRLDERLRDRELGVLDTLTARGVDARMPFEAERRRWLGKFYYRPPGGESWADLALRLRSFLGELDRLDVGPTVMVVCHDAPIMVMRYVLEQLTEAQILEIGRTSAVRNTSVTELVRTDGDPTEPWRLRAFDRAEHLAAVGVPVTVHAGTVDSTAGEAAVDEADAATEGMVREPR